MIKLTTHAKQDLILPKGTRAVERRRVELWFGHRVASLEGQGVTVYPTRPAGSREDKFVFPSLLLSSTADPHTTIFNVVFESDNGSSSAVTVASLRETIDRKQQPQRDPFADVFQFASTVSSPSTASPKS